MRNSEQSEATRPSDSESMAKAAGPGEQLIKRIRGRKRCAREGKKSAASCVTTA
jgi:hypothetical protein